MGEARTLTVDEARDFYDRFGLKQDRQAWYEDAAIDQLLARAAFERASRIVEVGCGTGRLALRLLQDEVGEGATYLGLDLSATMLALSRGRLRPYGERTLLIGADCAAGLPLLDSCCDRLVSTYVLDLLSDEAASTVLAEARRLLVPGGLLCLTSLAEGPGWGSRIVSRVWSWVHRLRPKTVGGCRPIRLAEQLPPAEWRLRAHGTVVVKGLASEWLVAEPSASVAP